MFEYELRVGKVGSTGSFSPGVSVDTFRKLQSELSIRTVEECREWEINPAGAPQTRIVLDYTGGYLRSEMKERIKKVTFPLPYCDYDCRFGVSMESENDGDPSDLHKIGALVMRGEERGYIRLKVRKSYSITHGSQGTIYKADLTLVRGGETMADVYSAGTTREFEIEYLCKHQLPEEQVSRVRDDMLDVLRSLLEGL